MKEKSNRIFIDTDKISRHLYCSICHEVFEDPSRLACGHTFCYACIENWASRSKLCPMCKNSLRHRKPQKDLVAAHIIDDLQCKCSHQNCKWIGVHSILKKHQRTCEHKVKKIFQQKNFNQVVQVNDDSQIKQLIEENIRGRKKIKTSQTGQNLPLFAPSSPQQQQYSPIRGQIEQNQLDIVRFRRNQQALQQISSNKNMQKSSSSTNSLSLSIPHNWLIYNTSSQKVRNDSVISNYQNKRSSNNYLANKNEKKQKTLSAQIRNLSFQQGQDEDQYRKRQRIYELQNSDQFNVGNLTTQNQQIGSAFQNLNQNRKMLQNDLEQLANQKERIEELKQQQQSNWINQSNSNQSNPFEEVIHQLISSQQIQQKNQCILLDSQQQKIYKSESNNNSYSPQISNLQEKQQKQFQVNNCNHFQIKHTNQQYLFKGVKQRRYSTINTNFQLNNHYFLKQSRKSTSQKLLNSQQMFKKQYQSYQYLQDFQQAKKRNGSDLLCLGSQRQFKKFKNIKSSPNFRRNFHPRFYQPPKPQFLSQKYKKQKEIESKEKLNHTDNGKIPVFGTSKASEAVGPVQTYKKNSIPAIYFQNPSKNQKDILNNGFKYKRQGSGNKLDKN